MAPLTLLVGENSTGKTSFLALYRALIDVAFRNVVPNFRGAPYDLGSFQDILHTHSRRSGASDFFETGFEFASPNTGDERASFQVTFRERDGVPFPVIRRLVGSGISIAIEVNEDWTQLGRVMTCDSEWTHPIAVGSHLLRDGQLSEFSNALMNVRENPDGSTVLSLVEDNHPLSVEDQDRARSLIGAFWGLAGDYGFYRGFLSPVRGQLPFAGAPVRSSPRRTYDPMQPSSDPEGEYIPTYLAMMSRRDPRKWEGLKKRLEQFGTDSGLFDEISIESFGRTDDATPFQIQIRKFGRKLKGNRRNLIDVGYGVSQTLPIITELLRSDAPSVFLLQQPEVHLHPSAQAALGSLFCSIAGPDRQLVVETHSDYIIDRVRMDVRDKKTDLKPEDVSILYFERGESDVKIHSVRLDEQGNVLDAPDSYGQFFMEETRRSIGL